MKRKYSASSSCVDENASFMWEMRGEWRDWLQMIKRQRLVTTKECRRAFQNLNEDGRQQQDATLGATPVSPQQESGQQKTGKMAGLTSRDFSRAIQMVRVRIWRNHMKAWICLGLYQRLRLLMLVLQCWEGYFRGTLHTNWALTERRSLSSYCYWPLKSASLWPQQTLSQSSDHLQLGSLVRIQMKPIAVWWGGSAGLQQLRFIFQFIYLHHHNLMMTWYTIGQHSSGWDSTKAHFDTNCHWY